MASNNALKTLRDVARLLRNASNRASAECPERKGRPSSTPKNRWMKMVTEEVRNNKHSPQVLEDVATTLRAVQEKRRLTIDWRGSMMTNAQLIKATAKRVGLAPPELVSDTSAKKN